MKGWLKDFKEFAMRGNVVDMAVGVIIGAAFGKIVTSLVNDVLMPPIGLLAGGMDFSNLFINLSGIHAATLAEAQAQNIPVIVYGFASVFLLVPLIRDGMGGSGFSWFTATLVLSLLITPTMVLTMESAVAQTARESRLAAESLGLSRAEHLVYVVLPACREWLWGAALLGFGRAAGDTMIPTMLAGNAVQYPASPFEAIRTLTAHIGLVLSSDVGGTAYYSLFVAGGILLALSTVANILFRAIRRGSERG